MKLKSQELCEIFSERRNEQAADDTLLEVIGTLKRKN